MRRFLTAFVCLSTLAMAQNVIAAAPASPPGGLEPIECSLTTTIDLAVDDGQVDSPMAGGVMSRSRER